MGEKYGRKVWEKRMGEKYGRKVWEKGMGEKYGRKVWEKIGQTQEIVRHKKF